MLDFLELKLFFESGDSIFKFSVLEGFTFTLPGN